MPLRLLPSPLLLLCSSLFARSNSSRCPMRFLSPSPKYNLTYLSGFPLPCRFVSFPHLPSTPPPFPILCAHKVPPLLYRRGSPFSRPLFPPPPPYMPVSFPILFSLRIVERPTRPARQRLRPHPHGLTSCPRHGSLIATSAISHLFRHLILLSIYRRSNVFCCTILPLPAFYPFLPPPLHFQKLCPFPLLSFLFSLSLYGNTAPLFPCFVCRSY